MEESYNKYYRKNYIKHTNKNLADIEFQIIEWHAQDESNENENDSEDSTGNKTCNDAYIIRCFGVTSGGSSVTCKIVDFNPFYYIKVPETFDNVKKHYFLKYIKESFLLKKKEEETWISLKDHLLDDKCKIIKKKDIFGFNNGKMFKFIKLVFKSSIAMNKSKYIFKNPVVIQGVNFKPIKFKLYESNIEPFMRYCHLQDILMAGWIKLPDKEYTLTYDSAKTQIEVAINYKKIISLKSKKDIANILQVSWDIETYSIDDSFPDPNKEMNNVIGIEQKYPNVIYQISSTFKYYNDSKTFVKYLLTLKKCDPIEDAVVIECKTEKDLIIQWCELISNMDPDIMYTWNGDCFDCKYVFERCKLYGLVELLKSTLSRLINTDTVIKKEAFSSSAYGDSDFLRFYIPGRLNYDLLIHYKRDMKKYSSYKLDYISNQILKEGKHGVSAKELFKYYKNGKSDEIKISGKYCIQDTELLQRLVDKQLILITNIQLSNVTFVPISYLTTRGQTIKVFSQVLRKAKQMNFLVPHTNFNEDTYPILLRPKESDSSYLTNLDINSYLKIECGRNKNSYGKLITINGKISEIIYDQEKTDLIKSIIVLSNIELVEIERFTAKFTYLNKQFQINELSPCDDLLDTTFTGATVLSAKNGYYTDNIAVLDFASLYPTCEMSRNLCYSTLILDPKYMPKSDEIGVFEELNENTGELITYERFKWDDKIEYTLNHTCEAIIKTSQKKCGKPAFFEIEPQITLSHLQNELDVLQDSLQELHESTDNKKDHEYKKEVTKIKSKLKLKQSNLNAFKQNSDIKTVNMYYCRTHDTLKNSRDPSEKFQKKDISYEYVVVQCTKDINGTIINKGVVPSLLEELYNERKQVKKKMYQAYLNQDKILEDILNSTQLAIKVSLNSVYGFVSRTQGNLILKPLGQLTTYIGRTLLQESINYSENEFINYIKEKSLLTHKIESKQKYLDLTDKDIILEQFKI